jgi:hypothetical protein
MHGWADYGRIVRRVKQMLVMGGHSIVPLAARGEAPWRELELLVESGLSPLEATTPQEARRRVSSTAAINWAHCVATCRRIWCGSHAIMLCTYPK